MQFFLPRTFDAPTNLLFWKSLLFLFFFMRFFFYLLPNSMSHKFRTTWDKQARYFFLMRGKREKMGPLSKVFPESHQIRFRAFSLLFVYSSRVWSISVEVYTFVYFYIFRFGLHSAYGIGLSSGWNSESRLKQNNRASLRGCS